MKKLYNYIKESLESNYLIWQLDQWFNQHEDEKQEFMNIIISCINDHGVINVEKYLNQTNIFKNNYNKFIEYLLDDPNINLNNEIDYIYNLKNIIQQLINNKSSKNKYVF